VRAPLLCDNSMCLKHGKSLCGASICTVTTSPARRSSVLGTSTPSIVTMTPAP
jgi:hypothetical protein